MSALRLGRLASILVLLGVILSGPVAIGVVEAFAPQPDWAGASVFIQHFNALQVVPYAFGFLLIAGCVALVAALVGVDRPERRGVGVIAVVLTAAFATFVLFNYVLQTTFVPALVAHPSPSTDPFIEAFSMRNPRSLAWALEMWGYAFVGVALALVGPALSATPIERWNQRLLSVNAVISVIGGVATTIDLEWVFTTAGLASFAGWNALMVAVAITSFIAFDRRARVRPDHRARAGEAFAEA